MRPLNPIALLLIYKLKPLCCPGPVPGYQNVLGSALWNLDVFLYSMSIGVNGIAYSENFLAFFLTWVRESQPLLLERRL